jgi:hypothetical protein
MAHASGEPCMSSTRRHTRSAQPLEATHSSALSATPVPAPSAGDVPGSAKMLSPRSRDSKFLTRAVCRRQTTKQWAMMRCGSVY